MSALTVSALVDGTARPMAAVVAACDAAAFVCYRWLVGWQPEAAGAEAPV